MFNTKGREKFKKVYRMMVEYSLKHGVYNESVVSIDIQIYLMSGVKIFKQNFVIKWINP